MPADLLRILLQCKCLVSRPASCGTWDSAFPLSFQVTRRATGWWTTHWVARGTGMLLKQNSCSYHWFQYTFSKKILTVCFMISLATLHFRLNFWGQSQLLVTTANYKARRDLMVPQQTFRVQDPFHRSLPTSPSGNHQAGTERNLFSSFLVDYS